MKESEQLHYRTGIHVYGQLAKKNMTAMMARRMLRACKLKDLQYLSAQWIARVLGVSPSFLSRQFRGRDNFDCLKDDILKLRLSHARKLLVKRTRTPIPEVAELVGYDDVNHFIRVFKKAERITPKQYRMKELRIIKKLRPAARVAKQLEEALNQLYTEVTGEQENMFYVDTMLPNSNFKQDKFLVEQWEFSQLKIRDRHEEEYEEVEDEEEEKDFLMSDRKYDDMFHSMASLYDMKEGIISPYFSKRLKYLENPSNSSRPLIVPITYEGTE